MPSPYILTETGIYFLSDLPMLRDRLASYDRMTATRDPEGKAYWATEYDALKAKIEYLQSHVEEERV